HSMNIWEGTYQQDPAFYKRIFVENRVFESPKHYFYPIPQSEIDKNIKHLLVQNVGWTTATAGDGGTD
ncbi:MAG: RagB/SusD family nutrient uptake outer membrane protein, partial [Bacteroidales bacterium]|nr:RagB/SusD family nutrient uptake outer membrane protein [Bacteroidales bacterium]